MYIRIQRRCDFELDEVFYNTDVSAANNGHLVLKTCPERWWFCMTQRVALAIDENPNEPDVREFFVQHKGKKTLTVSVEHLLMEWTINL